VNEAVFTGLPANNSDFGVKQVRLRVTGSTAFDVDRMVKVFYNADAFNWPGAPDPNEDPPSEANYFHYYMQTDAGSPTKTEHGPFYQGSSFCQEFPPYRYYAAYRLDLRGGQPILAPGVNGGQTLSYIDLFAWAARHEKAHHENWSQRFWGPAGRDEELDQDTDMIPDADEWSLLDEAGPYDRTTVDSHPDDDYHYHWFSMPAPDCERHNCNSWYAQEGTEEDQEASFEDDWAKPGKSWQQ